MSIIYHNIVRGCTHIIILRRPCHSLLKSLEIPPGSPASPCLPELIFGLATAQAANRVARQLPLDHLLSGVGRVAEVAQVGIFFTPWSPWIEVYAIPRPLLQRIFSQPVWRGVQVPLHDAEEIPEKQSRRQASDARSSGILLVLVFGQNMVPSSFEGSLHNYIHIYAIITYYLHPQMLTVAYSGFRLQPALLSALRRGSAAAGSDAPRCSDRSSGGCDPWLRGSARRPSRGPGSRTPGRRGA